MLLNQTVPVLDEEELQTLADTDISSSTEPKTSAVAGESDQEDTSIIEDESIESSTVGQADIATHEEDATLPSASISDTTSEPSVSGAPEETLDRLDPDKPSSESAMVDEDVTLEVEHTDTSDHPALDADLQFVDATDTERSAGLANRPADASSDESPEPIVVPVTWRKSTIPFREDQYDEIGRLIAEFRAEHGVQLTIAEFVRLGLDLQIQAFQDEETRPALLVELHEQQQRESQGNQNLKHSRSHGLSQYLARS